VVRDAERENILLEWDLGVPEEEMAAAPGAEVAAEVPVAEVPVAEAPAPGSSAP
jgi:hypothetical protein